MEYDLTEFLTSNRRFTAAVKWANNIAVHPEAFSALNQIDFTECEVLPPHVVAGGRHCC